MILVRFVSKDFQIFQHLVRVHVLAKSLNGQQLAREIISVLVGELQYPGHIAVAAVRGGARVNGAAIGIFKDVMYPDITNIICLSHSLDNIGKHFDTELLDSILHQWVSFLAHTPASRMVWKNKTGESMRSNSSIRWWSWWEVLAQLHRLFRHMAPFMDDLQSCPAISAKLRQILEDPGQVKLLCYQLAITIDMGKPLDQKTYLLEGDGELVVEAYTHLQEVCTAALLENYPQTHAVAIEIAGEKNRADVQELMTQAKVCVAPAVRYFHTKFNTQGTPMFEAVRLFKAVQILYPRQAQQITLRRLMSQHCGCHRPSMMMLPLPS